MAGWNTASTFLKIALITLSLGLILFVIGFATNSWVTRDHVYDVRGRYVDESRYGLWKRRICNTRRVCQAVKITSYFLEYNRWEDWYRATQAMECLGLICMAVALLILFLYFFVHSCKRRNALLATIIFTFASVVFIVIGVAVFASKMEHYGYEIGWSMGVAIAGAVLAFVAGIMEVIELR